MGAYIFDASPSTAFLPVGGSLRRKILRPERPVPQDFLDAYEDRALVYDAFRYGEGDSILLIGPPPISLKREWEGATFVALPGREALTAKRYVSLSQMIVELIGAPASSRSIEMSFAGERYEIAIAPLAPEMFAGTRLLTTMNKNNELGWIKEWASHHVRTQGTSAIVLFDNGSTLYSPGDIVETLASIDGLKVLAVPSWPSPFGAVDPRMKRDRYWSHFLQNASLNVVWRRFGYAADSFLNCDIDELTYAGEGQTVYDLVKQARSGFITFKGQWVEPVVDAGAAPPLTHADFRTRFNTPKKRYHRNSKWALDLSRPWLRSLKIHPYWHWLERRPLFSKDRRKDVFYWHFKGINTNWKLKRAVEGKFDPAIHEVDPVLNRLYPKG